MNLPHRSPRGLIRKDRCSTLCLIAVLGLVAAAPAWALRPVQVYQVIVRGASAATVVADGMREALVRATGRRDAVANPMLAGIVQNAGQYLRGSRSLAGGAVQLDFDGTALAQAIVAAGATLWDSNRPFTLIAISPVPTGPAGDALRIQLEQTAEGRGLPVSLVPLAVGDANGAPLSDAAVLQSAQALGGDAVLIGRADPATPGQWQWHLVSGYTSEEWTGDSDVGVNGAADSLASVAISSGSKALVQVTVQVGGVASLNDYARVEQLLRAVPGVQSSGLTAAAGTTASFSVAMRGGGEALVRALTGSAHLGAAATGATQVQLNYTP
ncbi:MAG TPA: DUF2066 domain-containing protein [Steroidobacteraceae bacterium]|jgi:hypothetical protein|nr:DUF2066 domain-containing protein [Steroidobacteraceae bacterium]